MFEVGLSKDAIEDLDQISKYYQEISQTVQSNFLKNFNSIIKQLQLNPFFQIRYDNFRVRQVKGFPILLHYIVYEASKTIIIYGIRHAKQNPNTSHLK